MLIGRKWLGRHQQQRDQQEAEMRKRDEELSGAVRPLPKGANPDAPIEWVSDLRDVMNTPPKMDPARAAFVNQTFDKIASMLHNARLRRKVWAPESGRDMFWKGRISALEDLRTALTATALKEGHRNLTGDPEDEPDDPEEPTAYPYRCSPEAYRQLPSNFGTRMMVGAPPYFTVARTVNGRCYVDEYVRGKLIRRPVHFVVRANSSPRPARADYPGS